MNGDDVIVSLTAFTHRIEFVLRCIELYGAERRISYNTIKPS